MQIYIESYLLIVCLMCIMTLLIDIIIQSSRLKRIIFPLALILLAIVVPYLILLVEVYFGGIRAIRDMAQEEAIQYPALIASIEHPHTILLSIIRNSTVGIIISDIIGIVLGLLFKIFLHSRVN